MPARRDDAAMQRGLPGVSAEEEALPSERVLSGELLGERRREAFRGMREALGNHADGFTREEFSVAVSLLCPPHLPPGSVGARGSVAYRARECFPGLDGPAAVRAYCEARWTCPAWRYSITEPMARGDGRVQAQQLACAMTHSDSDHFQPVFIERARDLGLRVMPLGDDKVWSKLVTFDGWAR